MARFRLARQAELDLTSILTTSAERWGPDARQRYAALLADAMRQIADEPSSPLTRARDELRPNIRSFHLRHTKGGADAPKVHRPVHVLYYRVTARGVIEIVRVLHERMDPIRHFDPSDDQ